MGVFKTFINYITGNHSPDGWTYGHPIGIVLHETANTDEGASISQAAESEQRYFAGGDRQASAHVFIDTDSVEVLVPFTERAWHAGSTANRLYLGAELCRVWNVNDFNVIYSNAVDWFADTFVNILKITKVSKDNLPSHAEISAKYKETDHTDPVEYFSKYGKTVDGFRADVQSKINTLLTKPKNEFSYNDTVDQLVRDGFATTKDMVNWEKYFDQGGSMQVWDVKRVIVGYQSKTK